MDLALVTEAHFCSCAPVDVWVIVINKGGLVAAQYIWWLRIAQAGGLHGVWLAQYIWRLQGRKKKGGWSRQTSLGAITGVCHSSIPRPSLSASLPFYCVYCFFLSFTSQPFFMALRKEIWGGQEIMASGWWLCESNARVHDSFLIWNPPFYFYDYC